MAARGFTLFELLVVIAIIGLVLAVVPGFLMRDPPGLQVDVAARAIADGLRQARSHAVLANREEVFALDIEGRQFRAGQGQPLKQLDKGLELGLLTARSELLAADAGQIRFFPDGSSTGGRIAIARAEIRAEVAVDWLTGEVSIHGAAP
jgi:general secretion pathway protein H